MASVTQNALSLSDPSLPGKGWLDKQQRSRTQAGDREVEAWRSLSILEQTTRHSTQARHSEALGAFKAEQALLDPLTFRSGNWLFGSASAHRKHSADA